MLEFIEIIYLLCRHLICLTSAGATSGCGLFRTPFILPAAFLDTTNQFIFFTFDELHIVMRQVADPLLEQTLDDVPICFEFGCFHNWATRLSLSATLRQMISPARNVPLKKRAGIVFLKLKIEGLKSLEN